MAKLEGTLESLLKKIDEVYRDCAEQKSKALSELRERKSRFQTFDDLEVEEVTAIGNVNNNTLKVLDGVISKKIELLKIHTKIVKELNQNSPINNPKEIAKASGLNQATISQLQKIAQELK